MTILEQTGGIVVVALLCSVMLLLDVSGIELIARKDLVLSLNLLIYKDLVKAFPSACYNQCYNKIASLRSAPNGQTSNYLC